MGSAVMITDMGWERSLTRQ